MIDTFNNLGKAPLTKYLNYFVSILEMVPNSNLVVSVFIIERGSFLWLPFLSSFLVLRVILNLGHRSEEAREVHKIVKGQDLGHLH